MICLINLINAFMCARWNSMVANQWLYPSTSWRFLETTSVKICNTSHRDIYSWDLLISVRISSCIRDAMAADDIAWKIPASTKVRLKFCLYTNETCGAGRWIYQQGCQGVFNIKALITWLRYMYIFTRHGIHSHLVGIDFIVDVKPTAKMIHLPDILKYRSPQISETAER